MKLRPFTIRARWRSIGYALQGIRSFLRLEHNARIHAVATLVVIGLALITGCTRTEVTALVIVTGIVWMAELFNTAMERLVDLVSPEYRQEAGIIKDLSAAAVLVAAVAAMVTGVIIFLPKTGLI